MYLELRDDFESQKKSNDEKLRELENKINLLHDGLEKLWDIVDFAMENLADKKKNVKKDR